MTHSFEPLPRSLADGRDIAKQTETGGRKAPVSAQQTHTHTHAVWKHLQVLTKRGQRGVLSLKYTGGSY